MNTGPLKTYAIQARKDFIQAVTDRSAQLGITQASIAPVQATSGSDHGVVVIAGAPFPASVVPSRERVVRAIERDGFRAVIEHVAYTWFNRLVALRYMEVHGYLDHGLRVLSDPGGGAVPEAVARLRDLDLPTLDKPQAIELAMAGNQDEALYRLILLAQCQHLAKPMPWLFDTRLHDGVDVLLPEHLLATDSLVRGLVDGIPEDDWKQGVEIIGWLYQFFISERKDEVIGSVVAPEDIPAATQLFTPNWIVQYLVQNSVGRLWMESYPTSTLRQHMPYYIEPALQDPAVQAELDKLAVRDRTPESLTVLDPACGSGHILVEAFRLLFRIYLERGHREREIPRLIFANNLFGLDIDDRAAQLACMTLLFEARKHDTRIFTNPPNLCVLAIQQSRDEDRAAIDGSTLLVKSEAKSLLGAFTEAKTLGSLLKIDGQILTALPNLRRVVLDQASQGQTIEYLVTDILRPLIAQAELMGRKFDAVIANPPYMGSKGMTETLKRFAKRKFASSRQDTFAMFVERGLEFTKSGGLLANVTMQNWMFLSSFEDFRKNIIDKCSIESLVQIGYNSFPSLNSKIALAASFVIRNQAIKNHVGVYRDLNKAAQSADKRIVFLEADPGTMFTAKLDQFKKISGQPIAYWVPKEIVSLFAKSQSFDEIAHPKVGMQTANNEFFLRHWHEVDFLRTSMANPDLMDWVLYSKGGKYRKWWGNNFYVLRYNGNGALLQKQHNATLPDIEIYNKARCTWTDISSTAMFNARMAPLHSFYDIKGHSFFPNSPYDGTLAYSNSVVFTYCMNLVNPGLNYQVGDAKRMPSPPRPILALASEHEALAVKISKADWDSFEQSFDFQRSPLLGGKSLFEGWMGWIGEVESRMKDLSAAETAINQIFISHFNLEKYFSAPATNISVYSIPRDSDGKYLSRDDICRLISYATGCMMGRYSLDKPGLIYAHSGGRGFDKSKYTKFPADADGIIPILDEPWFADDASVRLFDFISAAWPNESAKDAIHFIAESLGVKNNESENDTIRRYYASDFYADHCQTYNNKPIYWCFSSGKHHAFQCLVYLHRYNPDTLGRMRADYVIPLQGKLQGRLTTLTEEVARAGSTAQRKQAQKALDLIEKKIRELATFDDQLRSYADKRIELDLDDGVKDNIRKFGTLVDLKPLGNLDSEE